MEPFIGFEGPLSGLEGTTGIDAVWAEGTEGSRDIYLIRDKGARGLLNL